MLTRFMMRFGLSLLVALLAGHLVLADTDYDTARKLREAGDILPLETILHKIEKTYPGKVLEVELEKHHGKIFYEIELLDSKGKVRELIVDPRTAEIIKQKEEP